MDRVNFLSLIIFLALGCQVLANTCYCKTSGSITACGNVPCGKPNPAGFVQCCGTVTPAEPMVSAILRDLQQADRDIIWAVVPIPRIETRHALYSAVSQKHGMYLVLETNQALPQLII
jgi:hypothetical protein